MDLSPDFSEFFESLARHEVRYLVVGGYALAAHGHPRFTKGLDIWVWMDSANGSAVIDALNDFGFGGLGLTESDFLTRNTVVQLGYPLQRIDLLTSPTGVEFEDCWTERLTVAVDDLKIPVIGLQHLIDNKTAAGRDQDIADVAVLRRIRDRSR